MSETRELAGDAQRDAPGVLTFPPFVYLAGLAAGFAAEALLPSADLPEPMRWLVGPLLVVGGLALLRAFFLALRRARTAIDVRAPTTTIVTTGPYGVTRNPGYLAMALVYAGISLAAGALWPLLTLVAVLVTIDRGVVAREERYLERKFGEQYVRYKRSVRRWL